MTLTEMLLTTMTFALWGIFFFMPSSTNEELLQELRWIREELQKLSGSSKL